VTSFLLRTCGFPPFPALLYVTAIEFPEPIAIGVHSSMLCRDIICSGQEVNSTVNDVNSLDYHPGPIEMENTDSGCLCWTPATGHHDDERTLSEGQIESGVHEDFRTRGQVVGPAGYQGGVRDCKVADLIELRDELRGRGDAVIAVPRSK
jgi:hypothetical protein